MALLGDGRRIRAATVALLGVMFTALIGCALFDIGKENSFTFSHRVHVEDEGLDCSDCHMTVEDSDDPGIPKLGQCMLCHGEIDEEKPPERRIETLFDDQDYRTQGVFTQPDYVIFSHLGHVSMEEDCSTCHGNVESNDDVADLDAITMDACIGCHADRGRKDECSACHEGVGKEWAPRSHLFNWTRVHGTTVRGNDGRTMNDCSMCHTEQSCLDCHQQEAPQNHTNYWRLRGHSAMARMDRTNCATCHRTDFCSRCHESTEPMSHSGSWGSGISTHCLSCHFPLGSTGCVTCHKGTPSHLSATPLPPTHDPSSNCRGCHPGTAPLPHVDKGDACTLCHR